MDKKKLKVLGLYNYIKITLLHHIVEICKSIFPNFEYLVSVRVHGYKYPIWMRCGTSDYACFHLIFIQEEFHAIHQLIDKTVDKMIDCGTNVGYTIRYLIEKHHHMSFIGIEPDESNYLMALKNLAYYKEQVEILNMAIWSKNTNVQVVPGNYGDGGKWALQVLECSLDKGIEAISLNDIIEPQYRYFLKMDIEGTEKIVLNENLNWTKSVSFLCVELHDNEAKEIFNSFVKKQSFNYLGLHGEMHCISK
ncbi:FkbM family methyltransferase [Pedobacter puniceum]|uniref:FkbM family methyltransferase n=1 Tax=Pedobacter puniceum TaxID=2666136 RepID=A0A7K0FJ44_9SPHI|nr:FkbM family methyltransferase [Pedobacter puniceum]MRX45671.1 FkbM family methyltransferase [Pedobacter puniceum]